MAEKVTKEEEFEEEIEEEEEKVDEEYIRKGKEALEKGIVYIGEKPFSRYVTPCLLHLGNKGFVILKARGKYISKACNLALFLENKIGGKHNINLIGGEMNGKKYTEIEIEIRK